MWIFREGCVLHDVELDHRGRHFTTAWDERWVLDGIVNAAQYFSGQSGKSVDSRDESWSQTNRC